MTMVPCAEVLGARDKVAILAESITMGAPAALRGTVAPRERQEVVKHGSSSVCACVPGGRSETFHIVPRRTSSAVAVEGICALPLPKFSIGWASGPVRRGTGGAPLPSAGVLIG